MTGIVHHCSEEEITQKLKKLFEIIYTLFMVTWEITPTHFLPFEKVSFVNSAASHHLHSPVN